MRKLTNGISIGFGSAPSILIFTSWYLLRMIKKKMRTGTIKFITIAVACLLTFASLWLVFNEFKTKPNTELSTVAEFGRYYLTLKMLANILLIAPFLLALAIAGLYIFRKQVKPKPIAIITTASEQPPSMEDIYKNLKMLSDDEKLVISTIAINEGKILQKELKAMTKLPSYKITRILDRLEGLGLITRRKYGMTNIISLKFDPKKMPEL